MPGSAEGLTEKKVLEVEKAKKVTFDGIERGSIPIYKDESGKKIEKADKV